MPDYASKINIDGTEILLKGVPSPVVSRGVNGLCPALPSGSGTSKYLREDGSWQTPPNTNYIKSFGAVTLNYFSNIYLRGYISAPANATVIATLATNTDSVNCIRAILGASGTCEIRALGNFSSGASVTAYYVVLAE